MKGDEEKSGKAPVPIVVAIYHREDETRKMFKQLEKVTDDYSLILVNNGFDDEKFLKKLKPVHYVKNSENTGAIRPINQGLDLAEGEYVCVLHNDLLIYDEGWLDHIIEFMDRRQDVGLVGLAGRHGIKEDGSLDLRSTIVKMRGYPKYYVPTWRFTEVATIDGLGWVMRNKGFRLEESFGMMHFYDLDLSLQYIDAGDKVFSVAVDIWHMAENQKQSTRSTDDYLQAVGGSDDDYYEDVREEFRAKWQHLLPIWRGERDEAYEKFYDEEYDRLEAEYKKSVAVVREAETYVRKLERDWEQKNEEIADIAGYAHALEVEVARQKKLLDAENGKAWRAYLWIKSFGRINRKPPSPPDVLPPSEN
jgi:glycosyltransferase involved in cell wall biosynthesis